MRIIIGDENKTFFNRDHSYSDIVLVKNLFKEEKKYDIYHRLLDEIKINKGNWKKWHGNSHLIVDDKKNNWKQRCNLFNQIVKKLSEYFQMRGCVNSI